MHPIFFPQNNIKIKKYKERSNDEQSKGGMQLSNDLFYTIFNYIIL